MIVSHPVAINYLTRLDKKQRAAVLDLNGPVLIKANPGSGKTSVIAARVAKLLADGVSQERILCFTFTNKAADEMRSRIESYSGMHPDKLWIGTFHSICASLLRQYGSNIGIRPDFVIYTERESRRVIHKIMHGNRYLGRCSVSEMHRLISGLKMGYRKLEDWIRSQKTKRVPLYAEDVHRTHQAYVDELQKHNALDFDDLVVETSRMFTTQPDVSKLVSSQFHYILVDEFQDTSDVEWSIVKMIASTHGNICVVGDAKQSIFSFRGSNYQLMDQFKQDYPECHIHMLDTNYRSATRIISTSESLIRCSKTTPSFGIHPYRTDKGTVCISQYESDVDEATSIVIEARRLVDSRIVTYSDIAILFRQHWVSATLEECLESAGVPFRVADVVRDDGYKLVVECLKMIAQPSAEETMPRSQICAHIPSNLIIELRWMFACGASAESLVGKIVDYTYGSDWQSCPEKLTILWRMSAGNPGPAYHTLPMLFDKLSVIDETSNTNSIQLMSIHQSKGLEFPVVFLVGLEEGVLPCWQAIDDPTILEEERRLCYVAMTRAMDRLYLSTCSRRCFKHRNKPFQKSRFLTEMISSKSDNACV